MALTLRQAAALVASGAANGISMDGPCDIPRRVTVEGVHAFVENGVSCDVMTSGAATVLPATDPADEIFRLTAEQVRLVVGLVGRRKCVDLGIISDL